MRPLVAVCPSLLALALVLAPTVVWWMCWLAPVPVVLVAPSACWVVPVTPLVAPCPSHLALALMHLVL
jgi:hypothetical protein